MDAVLCLIIAPYLIVAGIVGVPLAFLGAVEEGHVEWRDVVRSALLWPVLLWQRLKW